jgi:hypothetical protein
MNCSYYGSEILKSIQGELLELLALPRYRSLPFFSTFMFESDLDVLTQDFRLNLACSFEITAPNLQSAEFLLVRHRLNS